MHRFVSTMGTPRASQTHGVNPYFETVLGSRPPYIWSDNYLLPSSPLAIVRGSCFAAGIEAHGIREWSYNSRMSSPGQSSEQVRQAHDIRLVVDAFPTLAWSARPDGSAEFLNRRWLDYTGLSAEEASDWGWTAAVHTEDRDRLMDFWRHLLASGEAGEIEARLRRYDGEYRWFL